MPFGPPGITPQSVQVWNATAPGALQTRFSSPISATSTTELGAQWYAPFACNIRKLAVIIRSPTQALSADVIILRVDGADTALTVTIPASASTGDIVTDLTHTVAVAAGQLVCVSWTATAVNGGANTNISIELAS